MLCVIKTEEKWSK